MTEFDRSEARAQKFYSQVEGDDSVDGKRDGTMLGGNAKPPPKKPPGSDDDYSGSLYSDVNIDRGDLTDYGDLPRGTKTGRGSDGDRGDDDPDASDRSRKMYDAARTKTQDRVDGTVDHSKDAKLGKKDADPDPDADPEDFWPQGYQPDDSVVAEFDALATRRGLNQAEREEMIGLYAREMHRHQKEGAAVIDAWADKARQDPELSANFDAKVAQAQEVLKQYGTQEFVDLLAGTGLGNHPEVIRVFTRIAKDIKHLMGRV